MMTVQAGKVTRTGGIYRVNDDAPAARNYAPRAPTSADINIFTRYGDMWIDTATATIYFVTTLGPNPAWTASSSSFPNQPITWVTVNSSVGTTSNHGYQVISGAVPIVLQLPTTSNVGDEVLFMGVDTLEGAAPAAPGYIISQGATQQVFQSSSVYTTPGPAGYLDCTHLGVSLTLVCVVANTVWNIFETNGGCFTAN
jgi:hypothetical protein